MTHQLAEAVQANVLVSLAVVAFGAIAFVDASSRMSIEQCAAVPDTNSERQLQTETVKQHVFV